MINVSHAKLVIRTAFFAFLAIAVLLGNLFLEKVTTVTDENIDVSQVVIEGNIMKIPGRGYVVMNDGKVSGLSGTSDVFILESGGIWGNFSSSISNINFSVGGKVVIIPVFADFSASFKDDVLDLQVYRGKVFVGFLPSKTTQFKYMNEYDPGFLNVLFIPAGAKAKVPMSKVKDRLSQLLYSKLIKEFSYGFIPQSDYKTDFVKDNLSSLLKYRESLKVSLRDYFKDCALKNFSYLDFIGEKMAVFENKKVEYSAKKLDGYLCQALVSEGTNVDQFLSEFKASLDDSYDASYFEKWLYNLSIFDSTDKEFKVLSFIIDESERFFDGLYLLSISEIAYGDVKEAYEPLYKRVEKLFNFTDDESKYNKFLSYYNQLFDHYLLRHPELYKSTYLEMKASVEDKLYALYYSGQLQDDLRQSFISAKISLLKRLKYFFFEGEIGIDDARDAVKILVEEINEYMPSKTSKNAIVDLFEKELNDIGSFWGYLNTAEYSMSSLYGEGHKVRYEVYLKERNQLTTILDVQRDILGSNVVGNITAKDVENEVSDTLRGIGCTSIKISDIDDVHSRFVKVAAILAGYSFDAEYDRESKSVKNVYAYGKALTTSSVKISGLKDFLDKKLSDVVSNVSGVSVGSSSDLNDDTNAQKIAKSLIAKKISESGFNAGLSNVDILDPVNAIYRLKDVSSSELPDTKISFDYYANDNNVKNLFVVKGKEEGVSVVGEFPLANLIPALKDEHL